MKRGRGRPRKQVVPPTVASSQAERSLNQETQPESGEIRVGECQEGSQVNRQMDRDESNLTDSEVPELQERPESLVVGQGGDTPAATPIIDPITQTTESTPMVMNMTGTISDDPLAQPSSPRL